MRCSSSKHDSSLVKAGQSETKAVLFHCVDVRITDFEGWQEVEAEDPGLYASLGSASYPRMSSLPSFHDLLPPDPSGEGDDSQGILDLYSYIYDTAEEIRRISSAAVDNCDMARHGHEHWSCRRRAFDKVERVTMQIVGCQIWNRAATWLAMVERKFPSAMAPSCRSSGESISCS